ncbi:hypothetical protein [Bremerella alba]|uniref:Uncharacterized protein n=1 Tax=Bremerella alba TaxID=980252 RepID=A0A7V9A902_9BACT|nr:hypothetical protein [Bremerella alba]MBA2116828.1 hypothetical protein [Bremerella alba]
MHDYLRALRLYSPPGRVDRDANIIFGCKIIQLGRVNDDRPFVIDQGTVQQVLTFAGMGKKGLKARFTHPNLCHDGLGRHLGRWKNFRQNGEAIYADLHISETSFSTPHGNLGAYVLDMAEDDPESFGVSIAAKLADQTKEALTGWKEGSVETIPYRMQALRAADIVGDPAATRGGLFSIETVSDRRDVPHFVSQFLATYFADADPHAVASQALRFISNHFGVPLKLNQFQHKQPSAEPKASLKNFTQAFGDQGYVYHGKGLSLADCYKAELSKREGEASSLRQDITARDSQIVSLTSRLDSAMKAASLA